MNYDEASVRLGAQEGARVAAAELRTRLAAQLESDIRPLLAEDKLDGGYNCCGCGTYAEILDHAIRIVRGD